jgi:hypothetical protein
MSGSEGAGELKLWRSGSRLQERSIAITNKLMPQQSAAWTACRRQPGSSTCWRKRRTRARRVTAASSPGRGLIALRQAAVRARRSRRPASHSSAGPATPKAAPKPPPRVRRAAKADAPLDIEELIRGTVAKVSAQHAADAERLLNAMRKAIDVLSAAVGA